MRNLALVFLFLIIGTPVTSSDFETVSSFLEDSVRNKVVAGGALLILEAGNVTYESAFGYADLESKRAFTVGTPVIIASISKPILGTLAYRLADQGNLNLGAPITDYLPAYIDARLESGESLKRPPTIIELLSHTGGTRLAERRLGRPWFATWTRGLRLNEVVNGYVGRIPFESQPGTKFAYSGIGTDIAAGAIEAAAGTPRNQLLTEEFANPLGMKYTRFRDSAAVAALPPLPTRYYRGDKGELLVYDGLPVPSTNTYSSSGGSIISTATDLAQWLAMIRNHGLHRGDSFLSTKAIQEMLTPVSPGNRTRGGFAILREDDHGTALAIGHSGSSGTYCWLDFQTDVIGIMLTQTKGSDIKTFRLELVQKINACLAEK